MSNFVSLDSPTSVASLAFIRDDDRIYTNEAVYLACMLHASGPKRTTDSEREVALLLDDHNLKP